MNLSLTPLGVILIAVFWIAAIAIILYFIFRKDKSSVQSLGSDSSIKPGSILEPKKDIEYTSKITDHHYSPFTNRYTLHLYNSYHPETCQRAHITIIFPNLFDMDSVQSLESYFKTNNVLSKGQKLEAHKLCEAVEKRGWKWLKDSVIDGEGIFDGSQLGNLQKEHSVSFVDEAGEVNPEDVKTIQEHRKNLKDGSPIMIDTRTNKIDTHPIGKPDNDSESHKENLSEHKSKRSYKASKCCGYITEVPEKHHAARCGKCNKFCSLI